MTTEQHELDRTKTELEKTKAELNETKSELDAARQQVSMDNINCSSNILLEFKSWWQKIALSAWVWPHILNILCESYGILCTFKKLYFCELFLLLPYKSF